MGLTRCFPHCQWALLGAYALWAASAAQAEYFLDDFEDGSFADGVPATWKRYAPPFHLGEIETLDGSLVLTPPTSGTPSVPNVGLYWETDVYLADRLYHDLNVKTQFRGLASGTSVAGLTVLDTESTEGPSGVFVGGHVYQEGATRWMRINYSGKASVTWGKRSVAPGYGLKGLRPKATAQVMQHKHAEGQATHAPRPSLAL